MLVQYPLYGPRDPMKDPTILPLVIEETHRKKLDTLPCPAYTPPDEGSSGYLSLRKDCWNLSCKKWLNVIVSPQTVEEVQSVVKVASNGQSVAVLSGGHSSMCMPDGAFVISL